MSKPPLDPRRYRRDPRSRPIRPGIADGTYAYVMIDDEIWVLEDHPHAHPKVLGGAKPADYTGDLRVIDGMIQEVTNLSGSFQFEDAPGLLRIAAKLASLGFSVHRDAVRFFPIDGSRPYVLEWQRD
jgi:hypothetical protein